MAEIAPATPTPSASPPPLAAPLGNAAPTGVDAVIAAAAKKARDDAKGSAPAPAPAVAAPVAAPTPGIKTEGANLADLTRLSSELRAANARVKELEPAAADAKLLKEVRDLYTSGKKIAAIGKLAGADPTAEMEALLADYLGNPNDTAVQDKLAAKIDQVAKRIDDNEAARLAAATASGQDQAASSVVAASIDERAAKLPHTTKADRTEAVGKVKAAVTKLARERGLATDDAIAGAPAEVIRAILGDAIDEVEIEYEVRAARVARAAAVVGGQPGGNPPAAAAAAPAAAEPSPTIESLERPGVAVQPWGKTLTHQEAREKLKAQIRAGQ